ncbi:MAG: hypothetical protein V8T45_08175 [Oscillospiraceae bacterium]
MQIPSPLCASVPPDRRRPPRWGAADICASRIRFGSKHIDGIFFSHKLDELGLHEGELVDLAFRPQINEYRGNVSVQLVASAMRRHDPRALCDAILCRDEQALWAASRYCPERADFVRLWRSMGKGFTVAKDTAHVIGQCLANMEPERFCLCLMALLETGLLSSPDGSIFSAAPANIGGKADLEGTRLMKTLHGYLS